VCFAAAEGQHQIEAASITILHGVIAGSLHRS
jgi:hypothetical protein